MIEAYDYSADTLPAGDNILSRITGLAHDQINAETEIENAEGVLKIAKDKYREIATRQLPDLMVEAGQSKITTSTGLTVEIKEIIRASITEERAPEAHAWLEDHQQGAIIKLEMKAEFGKGKEVEEKVRVAMEMLRSMGVIVNVKKSVHPQTLQSTLRELISSGVDVPLETFGAIIQKEAKVKLPKVK